MIHQVHENSLASFNSLDRESRRQVVVRVYEAFGPQTDREVGHRLGFSDLNAVKPRISEMVAREQSDSITQYPLIECGRRRDPLTNKTVRVVRLRLPGEVTQGEMFGDSVFNSNSGVRTARD